MSGDGRQLVDGMTATLSDELEGAVAHNLVADIVQAILDEAGGTANSWRPNPPPARLDNVCSA